MGQNIYTSYLAKQIIKKAYNNLMNSIHILQIGYYIYEFKK